MNIRGFKIVSDITKDERHIKKAKAICPKCGVVFVARINSLKTTQESCGCLRILNVKKATTTHGDSNSSLYRAYHHMLERCYKPNTKHYNNYGGKGVVVCDEWKNDYLAFKQWSLDNGWSEGLEIDKDILSGSVKMYSPTTCRWVTHMENCQHTSHAVGTSGFKGVTQDKRKHPNKSYFGQKTIFGKRHVTKLFYTPQEAYESLQILINKEKKRERS